MDEPSAALDNLTENSIIQSLPAWFSIRLSLSSPIVFYHSECKSYPPFEREPPDRTGTHEFLLETNDYYRSLVSFSQSLQSCTIRMREYAMQGLRPEIELLLSCARTSRPFDLGPNHGSPRIRNRLGLSFSHRRAPWLIPLLYWNLRTIAPELVPSPIMERIRTQFLANAGRNLLLTRKLLRF